ncbi:MAG TPA: amidase [Actinomycetota bacterium]|nr:amidase [Actinomycetota bacterium]
MDVAWTSARDQAAAIRDRSVSPVEVVTECLERIEKLDGELNAFVTVTAERALDDARAAAERVARGGDLPPFLGVPIAIKDLAETAGVRTTYSCSAFADNVPAEDSAAVRRIKDAGFVVVGKTNTPEFGTIPLTESALNGVCRNPWDTARTPGGSSGGSAAAVAAGMVAVAHGSDGGGSIRIPASCCGLVGIKPARGRVSAAPAGAALHGYATDGPLARSVADAAALLDVLAGYEPGDPFWLPGFDAPLAREAETEPGRLRIAVTTMAPTGAPVDPECAAAAASAAELLAELGHDVDDATPPWIDPGVTLSFVRVWQTLSACYPEVDPARMEPINRALAEAARGTDSIELVRAGAELQRLARAVVAFWDAYDVVVTPTLALPPVPVRWLDEDDADPITRFLKSGMFMPFTPVPNITGQPAVSVPLHWTADDLPVGVQLIGAPAAEATLVRLSAQLERARPWAERRPPVS